MLQNFNESTQTNLSDLPHFERLKVLQAECAQNKLKESNAIGNLLKIVEVFMYLYSKHQNGSQLMTTTAYKSTCSLDELIQQRKASFLQERQLKSSKHSPEILTEAAK